MTTIVWANGKLASDSLMSGSGRKKNINATKIFFPKLGETWKVMGRNVLAYGAAGSLGADAFVEEMLSSAEGLTHRSDFKMMHNLSFSLIIVDDTHQAWLLVGSYKAGSQIPDGFKLFKAEDKTAIGSGACYAECALRMGHGIKKAVKVAKSMDLATGGKVQVFKLPKAVKKSRKSPN